MEVGGDDSFTRVGFGVGGTPQFVNEIWLTIDNRVSNRVQALLVRF